MGRRAAKTVHDTDSTMLPGAQRTKTLFVYQGWTLLAEYDAGTSTSTPNLNLKRSFTWGPDLTGGGGAGGIGGLLAIQDYQTMYKGIYNPAYDGNGNLTALVETTTGAVVAAYEYDPYGNAVRSSGFYAKENPIRFSTKYHDNETGLVDFGLRYFSPSMGRFINVDPLREAGGINIYAMTANNPISRWDYLGMAPSSFSLPDGSTLDTSWLNQSFNFSNSIDTSMFNNSMDFSDFSFPDFDFGGLDNYFTDLGNSVGSDLGYSDWRSAGGNIWGGFSDGDPFAGIGSSFMPDTPSGDCRTPSMSSYSSAPDVSGAIFNYNSQNALAVQQGNQTNKNTTDATIPPPRGVMFLRLNQWDPTTGKIDSNSVIWSKLITDLKFEIDAKRKYDGNPLAMLFRFAKTPNDASNYIKEAEQLNFQVLISSHGSLFNNQVKVAFGKTIYDIDFYNQMNKIAGRAILSPIDKWVSCDLDHGCRTPQQIYVLRIFLAS